MYLIKSISPRTVQLWMLNVLKESILNEIYFSEHIISITFTASLSWSSVYMSNMQQNITTDFNPTWNVWAGDWYVFDWKAHDQHDDYSTLVDKEVEWITTSKIILTLPTKFFNIMFFSFCLKTLYLIYTENSCPLSYYRYWHSSSFIKSLIFVEC